MTRTNAPARAMFGMCFALALLPAAALAGESSGDEFTCPEYGFRVARPGAEWDFKPSEDPAAGTFKVIIQPRQSVGTIQIQVEARTGAGSLDAAAACGIALASIKDKPEYTNAKTAAFELNGRSTPGVSVDYTAFGGVFHVRQCYIVANGLLYSLECHAPAADFEKYAGAFQAAWESFALIPIEAGHEEERALYRLAARCGSEVEWASSWNDAADRARKEKKLVLVAIRLLATFNITDELSTGPFMDQDVIDLVRERFVPLRFQKGMQVPFVSQDSYGMGPSTFGTSLLVATPDGEVLGDTFSVQPAALCDFLIGRLDRRPGFTGSPPPQDADRLDRAEWHLRRGEHEAASALLGDPKTPRAHRLKAALLRRLRQGAEAVEHVRKARAAGDAALDAELAVEEAVILLRMARFQAAADILKATIAGKPEIGGQPEIAGKPEIAEEPAAAEHAEAPWLPEALYWLGACRLRQGDIIGAEALWKGLAADHSDNRWAWKAAAGLTATGFALGAGERLEWPDEKVLAILRYDDFRGVEPSRWRRAEAEAREFLLADQRADGSWISPFEVSRYSDAWPNEFTQAITAICGQSLLPLRKDERAAAAVRRAVDYLLAAHAKNRLLADKVYFMDYTVWSKAYTLWFFADCIAAGAADAGELRPVMAELIPQLRATQKAGGGWSYYVATELQNAGTPADQSISFVTAAVLTALVEAGKAGVAAPREMTDAAAGCLERMRDENGTFMYMLHHADEGLGRNAAPAGAAGRGPLCAFALYRYGRGSREEIARMLDTFVEHRDSYAKLHGKALMHTAPDGQGSHYLMFDYAFAAEAVRTLPPGERGRYRKALLDQILGARTADGAYLDNPFNGPHYATAMALKAFGLLDPAR